MTMDRPYGDDHGQDETADLVRSLALSSAKLWEELFERLRRLEHAQAELRELVAKIEIALPAAVDDAALGRGEAGPPEALPAATVASSFEEALANVRAEVEAVAGDGEAALVGATGPQAEGPAPSDLDAAALGPFELAGDGPPEFGTGTLDIGAETVDDVPLSVEWHVHEPEGGEGWTGAPPPIWTAETDADDELRVATPSGAADPAGEFDLFDASLAHAAGAPPPPPADVHLDDPLPPSPTAFDLDAPPPPPPSGFIPGDPSPDLHFGAPATSPDRFAAETPPPPPPGFHAEAPPSRTGFDVDAAPPPPPSGFRVDPPPPPATGFTVDAPPPPPPSGFRVDPPPPPPGFTPAAAWADSPPGDPATTPVRIAAETPPLQPPNPPFDAPPPPPPGFTPAGPAAESSATLPPTGLPQQHLGPGALPPPPPPGYTIIRPRTAHPFAETEAAPGDGAPPLETLSGTESDADGQREGAHEARTPAITPDFFARAGRRRY
jgi:hypothetical protein